MQQAESTLHTTVDRSRKYTTNSFKPYLEGKLSLPNFEPLPPAQLLNSITACFTTPLTGRILKPGDQGPYAAWGLIFPFGLQDGGYTGEALVSIWGNNSTPTTGRFSICKHRTKYLPSANPSRGLHDQFCELCGLDLSYDSSD
jgi:hypothetical protein